MIDTYTFSGSDGEHNAPLGADPRTRDSVYEFLSDVFGSKPSDAYVTIWRLSDKTSFFFDDLERAAEQAAGLASEDTYVAVALSARDLGPNRRCKSEEAIGIPGCWLDLDIRGPAHKKPNLPPTLEDALKLIPQDLQPSIIVSSGHGLQVWFLFKEPFMFDDEQDRRFAQKLVRRLERLIRQRAAAGGWDVDAVSELARVLRVPGTTNTKDPSDHRPVQVLSRSSRRYDPKEIEEYLDEAGVSAPFESAGEIDCHPAPFRLDAGANPPLEKFQLLYESEPRFKASWDHKRTDLQDQSPSAYDMSLATFAAIAKWDDQEIVNLLIAHRRRHRENLKLRLDYYSRTLSKAKEAARAYWAEQEADNILNCHGGGTLDSPYPKADLPAAERHAEGILGPAPGSTDVALTSRELPDGPDLREPPVDRPDTEHPNSINCSAQQHCDERRRKLLDALSTKLGIKIERVIKFSGEPPQFRIETAHGSTQLGEVDGLIHQQKLRSSVASATGHYLPDFSRKEWPSIAQGLLNACELVDRGSDATLVGAMTESLCAYLAERPPYETLAEADEGREPFIDAGKVCIFSTSFRTWLQVRRNEPTQSNRLTADLATIGAKSRVFHIPKTSHSPKTSRSAWILPAGPWDPVERPEVTP